MRTTVLRTITTTALCAGLFAGGAATAAAGGAPTTSPSSDTNAGSSQQGAQPGSTVGILPKTPLTQIPPTGPADPAGGLLARAYPQTGALPPQVGNIPQLPLQHVVPSGLTYPSVNMNHPPLPFGTIELPPQ